MNKSHLVHVRFEGRSVDLSFAVLDIGDQSDDGWILGALARHYEVPVARLEAYVIERHDNGNLTVRPEAVFG